LRAGCVEDIPQQASIERYLYVELRGTEPPGEQKPVELHDRTADEEADYALNRLTEVLNRFTKPDTPYASRERPMFMGRGGGDYDHLARVREWSLSGGLAEDESDIE
jgi:ATP-dependent helicase/nuclease subunit B